MYRTIPAVPLTLEARAERMIKMVTYEASMYRGLNHFIQNVAKKRPKANIPCDTESKAEDLESLNPATESA
jgi:hypothetical protein